jgi:hypothetical protein
LYYAEKAGTLPFWPQVVYDLMEFVQKTAIA